MILDKSKVAFTGKEYLEYIKYKDNKKIKFKPLSDKTKQAFPYFLIAIVGVILISVLISDLTYVQPERVGYTWKGIAMFLSVCAGIGWMMHGTGFLLVRR